MLLRIAALSFLAASGFSAAQAESHLINPIITAPDRSLPTTCYRIETDTLAAALLLEEIEGEAIDVSGFGDVTTAEGESWGFLIGFTGVLDGAILTGISSTSVDGDVIEQRLQWAFVDGGIVTDMGTFSEATCDGIEAEFIDRSGN